MSASSITEYEVLEGLDLGGGWTLGPIHRPVPGATGGIFSVQFDAKHGDGRTAFCKVLDLVDVSSPPNVAKKLELAAKAFNYEADLVEICSRVGARRIIYALHSDEVEDERVPLKLVKFIIFEQADADVRGYLDSGNADSLEMRFRALRHVALGLRELHDIGIAHQDLKPSNVVIFGPETPAPESKVADLGRASLSGEQAVHDDTHVAGAYSVSPPELLYRQLSPDFYERRQACDLYQMGCLIAFVIAGVSINREWNARLAPDQRWRRWGGPYSAVYPLIRSALDDVFHLVEAQLDPRIATKVGELVRDLCDPDPTLRGAALKGPSGARSVVLGRLVTRLNVLEHQARTLGLRAA